MIVIKKILVATDFSDHSSVAFRYAVELAGAFDAKVLLCHVVEGDSILSQIPPGGEGYFPPNVAEIQKQNAQNLCERILADSPLENAEIRIAAGKPFVEIIRLAREENADLLIVGTHGRGPIRHMLLGSVAERVVRKSSCPVLTVREGEHEFVLP